MGDETVGLEPTHGPLNVGNYVGLPPVSGYQLLSHWPAALPVELRLTIIGLPSRLRSCVSRLRTERPSPLDDGEKFGVLCSSSFLSVLEENEQKEKKRECGGMKKARAFLLPPSSSQPRCGDFSWT